MTMIDKAFLEALLADIGGSAAAILLGQPERQTPDIAIWGPESDFDPERVRQVAAASRS